MFGPRHLAPRLQFAALILLGGCGNLIGSGDCTLIGCINGLRVQFSAPPEGAFRVEARAAGSTAVYAVDCASAAQCAAGVILSDYTPDQVTITVVTARGSKSTNLRPEYTQSRPNGEGCGPVCVQALVTVPSA